MNKKVLNAAVAFTFLGVVGALGFQNCSKVAVSDIPIETPVNNLSVSKDCPKDGKSDGDTWWIPVGTARDLVACQIGTGDQFQVYNIEMEVKCNAGTVVQTDQTRRTPAQIEGLCNLDCGTHKNGETWLELNQTLREPLACAVGTGTQQKVYDELKEYKCENASIVATGHTEKRATGVIEGQCNLDCGTHKNTEKWFVADGTSKQALQCTVGTGTQYKIFNNEIEYQCLNAVASPTGQTRQTDSGQIEGTCNLDCGTHKNADLWWELLPESTEIKKCATSLSATSTIKYKNEAQYNCVNAVTGATGQTRQTVLSETECPPLTFNDKDSKATVAYEDILRTKDGKAGDHDYNDFVANIKVLETYNSLEQLNKIQVEYTPKLDTGGYPAKFVLVFNGKVAGRNNFVSNLANFTSAPMFEGSASIKFELFDSAGNLISSRTNVPKDQDLLVFDNVYDAVRNQTRAVITVTNLAPDLNTLTARKGLSIQRYRSVLFVKSCDTNEKYDIDLSDINPSMFDAGNYPLAFFVPENWRPPMDGVNILTSYPNFSDHASYLYLRSSDPEAEASKNWFNYLINPTKTFSQDGSAMRDSCSF